MENIRMAIRIIYWNKSLEIFDVREGLANHITGNFFILRCYLIAKIFRLNPFFEKFDSFDCGRHEDFDLFSHVTLEIVRD